MNTYQILGASILLGIYIILVIPTLSKQVKRRFIVVDPLTLEHNRRRFLAFLYGLIIAVPTALFIIGDMIKSKDTTAEAFLSDFVLNAAHILVPIMLCAFRPLANSPLNAYDLITMAVIYIPLVFSDVSKSFHLLYDYQVKEHWQLEHFSSLKITSALVALLICIAIRPLPDVGIGPELSFPCPRDFIYVTIGLIFAVIPFFPIGVSNGFLKRKEVDAPHVLLNFVTLYFFVSLPLDIFFRGFVQNLLHAKAETGRDEEIAIWGIEAFDLGPKHETGREQSYISTFEHPHSFQSEDRFSVLSTPHGEVAAATSPVITETNGQSSEFNQDIDVLPDLTYQEGRGRVSELTYRAAIQRGQEGAGPPVPLVAKVEELPKKLTILQEAESPRWPTWQQKFYKELNQRTCGMFLMPTWKDWLALVIGACLYAFGLLRQFASALDGKTNRGWAWCFGLLFWDGLVRGYVWRMTGKVYLSAFAANLSLILGFCVYAIDIQGN